MVSEYVKMLILVGIMAGVIGTVNRGIDAWVTREQAYFLLEKERVDMEKEIHKKMLRANNEKV